MENVKEIVYIDWTLVFTWVNFIILFFILKHFLYKPVKKMLKKRQDEVDKTYNDADIAKKEALAMKSEYEVQISSAKQQAQEIVTVATNNAQIQADEIVKKANKDALALTKRANSQIELEKRKAVSEIKDSIAELAILAATEVVTKEIDTKENEQLINEFLETKGDL